MSPPITARYAALLALMFVVLALRAIRLRRRLLIPVGDGGHANLRKALRAHGNFAEYVPFALLLIYLLEVAGASPLWVHGCGSVLLLGRLVHAFGVSQVNERYGLRVGGMVLTLAAVISAASRLLAAWLWLG